MAGKPGHGGKKGRSGRKKLPSDILKSRIEALDADIPAIIDAQLGEALGKPIICQFCGRETGKKQIDREAGKNLWEMRLGKARQFTEVDLMARTELTSTQALKMYRQIQGYADRYALENPQPLLDQVKLLSSTSENRPLANPDTDGPHNEHITQI